MPQISKRLRISFSLTYLKNPMDRHISVLMNKRIATMQIKKNYKNIMKAEVRKALNMAKRTERMNFR